MRARRPRRRAARRLDAVHARASARPSGPRRAAARWPARRASAPSPASPTTSRSVLRLEDHAEAHAQQLLVVDEQDADGHAGAAGSGSGTVQRARASRRSRRRAGLDAPVVDAPRARACPAQAARPRRSAAPAAPCPSAASTTSTSIALRRRGATRSLRSSPPGRACLSVLVSASCTIR